MGPLPRSLSIRWPGDEPAVLIRGAATIGLLALVVRLAYYYELSSKPYFGVPLLDSRWWLEEATRGLFAGEWAQHVFFRPPLYTLLLGVFAAVFGQEATLLVPLFQLILGSGFCVLIFLVAARCWNAAAGLAAGCLAALNAPLVFSEAEILSDTVALFLLSLFLYYFVRAVQTNSARRFFIAGLAVGLAILTRANALPIAAIFAVAQVGYFAVSREIRTKTVRSLAAYLLPVALAIALPTLHNWRQGDFVVVCAQGGINFYIGNNPSANGANVILPKVSEQGARYRDTVEEFAILGYLADRFGPEQAQRRYAAGERPRWSEIDRFWYAKAFEFLRAHPGSALRLYARKLVALTNNLEVRNNRDFQFAASNESQVLRFLPVRFALVFALGVYGLLWWRRATKPGVGWVLVYLACAAGTVLAYFVAGRLRLIVLPGLLVFAGIGVERCARAFTEKQWREAVQALAVVLCAGIASCYSWPQLDFRYSKDQLLGDGIRATSFWAGEQAVLANACYENRHFDKALEYAQAAITAEPSFGYAWLVMGNAHAARGEWEKAAAAYLKAWRLDPASTRARNNLAVALEKLGRYQEATEVYLDVLRDQPENPRANANLAALLLRSGDVTTARAFAEMALENDPQQELARAVLAVSDPRTSTTTSHRGAASQNPFAGELSTPLPIRVDLTSSRTLQQIFPEAMTTSSLGQMSSELRRDYEMP